MAADIIGIDKPCLDLNVGVEKFPKQNAGSRIRERTWQGGGKVATGLAAASRLGASCSIIGAVGDDLYGRFCYQDMERHGVGVEFLAVDPGRDTALSIVISDRETGGRSISHHPGSVRVPPLSEEAKIAIIHSKCLFLASAGGINVEAAAIAHDGDTIVLMDADDISDEMAAMIPMIDAFIASEDYYLRRCGGEPYEAALKAIIARGPAIAMFTLGEKGCVGIGPEGYFELDAFRVDVVDTVGAGDVFHGAYAAALIEGMGAREAARFASAVSAIKCTRIGGRAGIPSRETVDRFLSGGGIDAEELDRRVEYYRRGLDHV